MGKPARVGSMVGACERRSVPLWRAAVVGACLAFVAGGCVWPEPPLDVILEPICPPDSPQPTALLNLSADAADADEPFDPERPTVVIVHGLNVVPCLLRYGYLDDMAGAITARVGAAVNIAALDYNTDSIVSLLPGPNPWHTAEIGRQLGRELVARGVTDGERVQMIGHSLGAFAVATAAAELGGVAQITLIEAAWFHQPRLLCEYGLMEVADEVEHYWSNAFGGFGVPIDDPKAFNHLVRAQDLPVAPELGLLHWAHFTTVLWYLETMIDLDAKVGFARSAVLELVAD